MPFKGQPLKRYRALVSECKPVVLARWRPTATSRCSHTDTCCACWARAGSSCPPAYGGHLALSTAALCELGYERERRAIWRWNLR